MSLHERRFRERPCCWPIVSRSATLPTVAMAAAVPTFSWTYKAGQQQQLHPLCPRVHGCNCFQGQVDVGYSDLSWFQLLNVKQTRSERGSSDDVEGGFICAHDYTVQYQRHPEGLSAILSQVHGNVQQKKRLRELTLIHFDSACLKNENTFLRKCHFSFTALFKVLQRNIM